MLAPHTLAEHQLKSTKNADLVWLFDLDNTLHHASWAIFPAINDNMNAYIAEVLGDGNTPASADEVNRVRQIYYQRYGITMLGMVKHHGVDAEDFLQRTHQIDKLRELVRVQRGLIHVLKRLPGKKYLLTNAPRGYAMEIVRHLGLHKLLKHIICVEDMHVHRQFRPKPSRPYLRKLLAKHGLRASRCVLVEDSLENLRAAKQEGLQTVWLHGYIPASQIAHQRRWRRNNYTDKQLHSLTNLRQHF